jgi:DNA repair protein RadC
MLQGAHVLKDAELVAVILGTGTRGRPVQSLARDVLAVLDREHAPPSPTSLIRLGGLGTAKAASLCAGFELARRVLCPAHHKIGMPTDVLPLVARFADRNQEHFICISLNGAHEVIAVRVVSVGLVNRTMVHPREVFADAITDRAAAVIVAHNHPSGSVTPSGEDRAITRRLEEAGNTLGIPVLDHVIFAATGHYSFLENGGLR